MTSRQLQDLTPQELADHAHEIKDAAREALVVVRRERRGVGPIDAPPPAEEAAVRVAVTAAGAARAAEKALELLVTNAAAAADKRTEAIAKLDILHRQQIMGEWSMDINEATKQEVKKHMGSMLGDCDKAGKLSKRRIKKNIRKTKRRRQKITKRRR
jgi:hypothetical protein